MSYDPNNIFSKILRGEIPCQKVFEDEWTLAFHDVAPQAPVHILIIPKGQYLNVQAFGENASPEEVSSLMKAVSQIARQLGLDEDGYRLITNNGEHGGQEVQHLHFHLCGGRPLGSLLEKKP